MIIKLVVINIHKLSTNSATQMKPYLFFIGLILNCLSAVNSHAAKPVARQRLLMDDNWKFIQADITGAEKADFNDQKWRKLNLPHDWSIEGEFKKDAPTTRLWRLSSCGYWLVPQTFNDGQNQQKPTILDRV